MMPLVKRVALEKRSIVLPLAVALVANIVVYAFIVYPLGVRSTGSAERAAAAAANRQAATREEAAARALVTGKAKADEELAAFYDKVLPADQAAARRMMFTPIFALARKTDVLFQQSHFDPQEKSKDSRDKDPEGTSSDLSRLTIRVVLQGDYRNIRSFIYQLESAPDFVIIDGVTLIEGSSNNEPQKVTLDLSTYFKLRADGL
jgi:hypothetical protein